MEKITIGQAQRLTSPNPFALLSVLKPDGTANFMALSSWIYAADHPPMIAVCLSNRGYSGECIKNTGTFGLSVVGESLRDAAMEAGKCSGRSVDKQTVLGIPSIEIEGFAQPVADGSRVCLSCRLAGTADAGDHTVYLGEVVAAAGDESVNALYALCGYSSLGTVEVTAE